MLSWLFFGTAEEGRETLGEPIVTMHVVLGDGEMPAKALTETLGDLFSQAEAEGQTFWFLVHAKPEPTATDKAMMAWLTKQEIYYETISDGTDVDEIYSGTQEKHTAKQLAPKIVNLLRSKPEEDEPADLLALFASDDPDAEEDRWLNAVIQKVFDGGFPIYALTDGLVEVDMSEDSAAAEVEPEPAPVKKSVAKKVAAAKKAAAAIEDAEEVETGEITREFLENLDLDKIKAIAANRGIELPPRTRAATYVDRILGEEAGLPEAEVSEVEEMVVVSEGAVTASAMVIVVYDGVVISRAVSVEEAEALVAMR
jgi:hypothetical protein